MSVLEEINWENLASNIGKDVFGEVKVLNAKDIRIFFKQLTFKCNDCNEKMIVRVDNPLEKPNYPKRCSKCNSKNIELVREEGKYEEYQKVKLTDAGETSGRQLLAILTGELVNSLRRGDVVYVEGYMYSKTSKSSPEVTPVLLIKRIGIKKRNPEQQISKGRLMKEVLDIIEKLQSEYKWGVPVETIIDEMTSRYKISEKDVKECLDVLVKEMEIYEPKLGCYKRLL